LAFAEELAQPLAEILGGPLYPHAASHMRRRVNPPQETWAAFARDARGYKRWVHLRVAVSGSGVRVVVFVDDDADDKPTLAAALQKRADHLAAALVDPRITWYGLAQEGEAPPTGPLQAATLRTLGERLARTKTLKFQAGIPFAREAKFLNSAKGVRGQVLDAARALAPLYRAGVRE
jgi:uncharacterized protein YktB (UPF0637 family)